MPKGPYKKLPYMPIRTTLVLPASAYRAARKLSYDRALSVSYIISMMMAFALENQGAFADFLGKTIADGGFPILDGEESK